MRNFNQFIAGGLIAIAIFIICNCAGYLIVSTISSSATSKDLFTGQTSANTSGPAPIQASVVAFVTPTSTAELTLSTPVSPSISHTPIPAVPPLPLLPTITPGLPTSTPVAPHNPTPTITLRPPAGPPIQANRLTPTQTTGSSRLQILSHQSYVDSLGWYHIVGEVQNNSTVPNGVC